ncbi:hypothetical protein CDD82_831 [Ophiocordyceps australis]|uniref:Uncharacterized protein n=1 Tax=Ophiocordyceps australis TaxID=1399860 RepID=A0A2C5YMF3_9HYPO|nr:hypothetical protein CDD82_831 [Ophiocordyceps australis]
MASAPAWPIVWQFDVASRATLNWLPPTSSSQRKQQQPSGILRALMRWMDTPGTSSCPPAMHTPADDAAVHQHPHLPSIALPPEVSQLRAAITRANLSHDKALQALRRTYRRSLRRRIEARRLSAHHILASLDPLDAHSTRCFASTRQSERLAAMIRRTLLSAMGDAHDQDPAAISPNLWLLLAQKICTASGSNQNISLFYRLTQVMPALLRAQISRHLISSLARAFVTAQASRHSIFSHWLLTAATLGKALQNLTASQCHELDQDMNEFLSHRRGPSEMEYRLRFSWMTLKAHDARATIESFGQTYKNMMGPEFSLNSLHLWQILMARLVAIEAIDRAQYKALLEAKYSFVSQRWTGLVVALMASKDPDSALSELCRCLVTIDQFDTVSQALTSPPHPSLRMDAVQALATACNDHREAIKLYNAVFAKRSASNMPHPWAWTMWAKYVESMILDAEIDSLLVWNLINLGKCPPLDTDAEKAAQEVAAKMQLLDRMGQLFTQSPHLSNRQVLRNLQRCIKHQRVLVGSPTLSILASLTDVVTRGLCNGQNGHSERLRWLVDLIAENRSPQEAKNAGEALKKRQLSNGGSLLSGRE